MKLYRNNEWSGMDQQNHKLTHKHSWIYSTFMGPYGHITENIWRNGRISSKNCATGRAHLDRKLCDILQNCATISTVAQVDKSLLIYRVIEHEGLSYFENKTHFEMSTPRLKVSWTRSFTSKEHERACPIGQPSRA